MASGTEKRRLSAQERRARILDAAVELIAQRGYDRISVSEIAAAAGCSKAVLYDHFKSKGELAVAAVEETNLALLSHVAAAVDAVRDESKRVRIERGLDAFFEFIQQRPTACRTLFRDPSADPEVFDAHTRAKRVASQGVAAMLASGFDREPQHDDHELMLELFGEILTSALAGLALWWEYNPEVPRADLVRATVSFSFLGLERLAQGERLEPLPDAEA
jgi:AcrR family transcriptional regulator